MSPRIIFIIRGHVVRIICAVQTRVHFGLDTSIVVEIFGDILLTIRRAVTQCYLCQQALCIVLIFSYTILYCIRILLLNSLLCQRYIAILVILIFRYRVVDRSIRFSIERCVGLSNLVQITILILRDVSQCICLTSKLPVGIVCTSPLSFTICFFVNCVFLDIGQRFGNNLLVFSNVGRFSCFQTLTGVRS